MTKIINCIISIISICLLLNCTPEFQGNTRVLTKGIVTNQNGVPIPNAKVEVYTLTLPPSAILLALIPLTRISQNDYLLGSGVTDSQGRFSVTSLLDRDQDFYIFIDGNDTNSNYIYATNTTDFVPDDYTFDLGDVVLKRIANVDFQINRTSSSGTVFNFNISFEEPGCAETFEENVIDTNLSNCYPLTEFNRMLDDERPDFSTVLNSTVGSTITVIYSVNGGTDITETYLIDSENYVIELTY